jgi:hypothetical protein
MVTGAWVTQAIYIAAELGVADMLHSGPLASSEIAARAAVDPDALHRVLRCLASLGIFRQNGSGQFEQTPVSEYLRTGIPGSLRAWARMFASKWSWDLIGSLMETVRTGAGPAWNGWEHFEQNPHDAEIFNESMTSFSAGEIGPLLAAYSFAGIHKLMDVAGGFGSLLAAVLEANPEMQGVLFDAPSVIEGARSQVAATKAAARCELVGGDFFASVPSGADAIMMKHIIHDWNDENSLKILKNCHAALPAGGKLLVIDPVILPGNEPALGKLLDIQMLLIGGRERTEAEFRALFDAAGFEVTRIVPTASPVSVVEGRKR